MNAVPVFPFPGRRSSSLLVEEASETRTRRGVFFPLGGPLQIRLSPLGRSAKPSPVFSSIFRLGFFPHFRRQKGGNP